MAATCTTSTRIVSSLELYYTSMADFCSFLVELHCTGAKVAKLHRFFFFASQLAQKIPSDNTAMLPLSPLPHPLLFSNKQKMEEPEPLIQKLWSPKHDMPVHI